MRGLLERVWTPARRRALADRDAMQALVQSEGGNFTLAPWDWRYYAEKLRKARCDVDEAAIKPYLQLDRIIAAAFHTANRLFGLRSSRSRVPVWHRRRAGLGGAPATAGHIGAVLRRLFRAARRSTAAPG